MNAFDRHCGIAGKATTCNSSNPYLLQFNIRAALSWHPEQAVEGDSTDYAPITDVEELD